MGISAKFKVEKLTDSKDFGLWRLKMRALLVHQGLEDALKGTGWDRGGGDYLKPCQIKTRKHW